jgi:hypothetical protein
VRKKLAVQLAPLQAHQGRKGCLIPARKSRQVRIRKDVGAVLVLTTEGDGEAYLVQARCPDQKSSSFDGGQPPGVQAGVHQYQGRTLDAIGLICIHLITFRESADRAIPYIFVAYTAYQVIEQAFAKSGLDRLKLL